MDQRIKDFLKNVVNATPVGFEGLQPALGHIYPLGDTQDDSDRCLPWLHVANNAGLIGPDDLKNGIIPDEYKLAWNDAACYIRWAKFEGFGIGEPLA